MDFLYLGCPGLSLLWLLSLWSTGSRTHSSCSSRGLELRLSSCGCMGLVAPEHVKSSWTRDQIHVPCFGRQILNHWATREVHMFFLAMSREHGLVHFIIHQAIHLEILPFLYICYILQ